MHRWCHIRHIPSARCSVAKHAGRALVTPELERRTQAALSGSGAPAGPRSVGDPVPEGNNHLDCQRLGRLSPSSFKRGSYVSWLDRAGGSQMKVRRYGVFMVIAALIGFGAAQLWPDTPSNGTISGLMEAGGGTPEVHIAVPGVVEVLAEGAHSPTAIVNTDIAGRFSVSLASGQYRLVGLAGGRVEPICVPDSAFPALSLAAGQRLTSDIVCLIG